MRKLVFSKVIDFFLPPVCFLCRDRVDQQGICSTCWGQLSFITVPFCQQCAYPFSFGEQGEHLKCGGCLEVSPYFTQTRAAFKYDAFSKQLILSFKHGKAIYWAGLLAEWMRSAGREMMEGADFLVPVPLHWTRLWKRGFNQAALLAQKLQKKTYIPYNPYLLKRTKRTPSQGNFRVADRAKNVKDVFEVPGAYKELLSGKTIVLIDDVMTSGTTVNACAKALLKGGAKEVRVLVAARVL